MISASRIPTLPPWRARVTARSDVTSDLPTPPLPLITATAFPMWFSSRAEALNSPLSAGPAADPAFIPFGFIIKTPYQMILSIKNVRPGTPQPPGRASSTYFVSEHPYKSCSGLSFKQAQHN
ncbi:MAG: hypothetical protein ACM3YE_05185 [Bacteroidota bacterium]